MAKRQANAKRKREQEYVPEMAEKEMPMRNENPELNYFWASAAPFQFDFANSPKIDVLDEGDSIVVEADLPGVKSERDINVNVSKSSITLQAKSAAKREEKGKNYYYRERSATSYYRMIPMPTKVDPVSVSKQFKNEILRVRVKKSRENRVRSR